MKLFADAYQPLIGSRLTALAWRPVTCDTATVVASLRNPFIEISGAASLFFGDSDEVILTWTPGTNGYRLTIARPDEWGRFSLDTVHASHEDPWGLLVGACLMEVALFKHAIGPQEIIALRHRFESDGKFAYLWVGVGRGAEMQDADDLVVCVEAPANIDALAQVDTIKAP